VFGVLLHDTAGTLGLVGSAVGWLAWVNLLLGAFNLVPAAPLDGGRVLRAILWHHTGDRVAASTAAAHAGEVFGYVLVGLGALEFFTVSVFGLWFVFLGIFLLSAARAEKNDVVLRSSLATVHVRDLMTPDPVVFPSGGTVAELVDQRLHHVGFGTFPLVRPDGQLEGLTTLARIRRVPPQLRATTRLIDTACPLAEVPAATPDEPVPDLLQRLQGAPDGRALVIGPDRRLVGIVSPSDIARYVQLAVLRPGGRTPQPS
jgi:CBS domain-containing protein